jgi:uncharacterized repeat protein (TIGR03803 family)
MRNCYLSVLSSFAAPRVPAKPNLQPRINRMTKPKLLLIAVAAAVAVTAIAAAALYQFREMRPARYSVIYRFSGGADGSGPVPGLATDAAGNLYGMTSTGGKRRWGTIFKLSPPSPEASGAEPANASAEIPVWQEQIVSLNPSTVGGSSAMPPIMDHAGALYGMTASGGPSPPDSTHEGMLFKLETSGPGLSDPVPVYSMPIREFNDRCSDLISDASGALYGTTSGRGAESMGTVFKLSPTKDGWTMVTLYSFRGGDDGAYPEAGLVFDRAGTLYGTTGGGGKDGMGTVFKLTPTETGWDEKVIHIFHQPDPNNEGMLPMAGLTVDAAGTLYGTTGAGGILGEGTIFTLTPSEDKWTYRVLYSFSGRDGDGAAPNSRLVFGTSGELYGTTRYGGVASRFGGKGTVFRLAPTWFGWKQATIHGFAGGTDGDGSSLSGALVRSKSGALFGATSTGGGPRNSGTVFEVVP